MEISIAPDNENRPKLAKSNIKTLPIFQNQTAVLSLEAPNLTFYPNSTVASLNFTPKNIFKISEFCLLIESSSNNELFTISDPWMLPKLVKFNSTSTNYGEVHSIKSISSKNNVGTRGSMVMISKSHIHLLNFDFCGSDDKLNSFEDFGTDRNHVSKGSDSNDVMDTSGLDESLSSFRKSRFSHSPLTLSHLWSLQITNYNPSKDRVFHFNGPIDISEPLIWIFSHSQKSLIGYTKKKTSEAKSDEISPHSIYRFDLIMSVCSVRATRKDQDDLLLLKTDQSLWIWNGFGAELLPCQLPVDSCAKFISMKRKREETVEEDRLNADFEPHSNPKAAVNRERDPPAVVELNHISGSKVSFLLNNDCSLTGTLNFKLQSRLVQLCLKALRYTLSEYLFRIFEARLVIFHFGKESLSNEWNDFQAVLFSFFHKESCANNPSSLLSPVQKVNHRQRKSSLDIQQPTSSQINGDDAWLRLINRGPQCSSSKLLPMDIQNLFAKSSSSFDYAKNSKNEKMKPIFEAASKLSSFNEKVYNEGASSNIIEHFFVSEKIEAIICSLHLLYDELNVCILSQQDASNLIEMLGQLSFSLTLEKYAERYHSEYSRCQILEDPTFQFQQLPIERAKACEPPLRIMSWIEERVSTMLHGINTPMSILYTTLGESNANLFAANVLPKMSAILHLYNTLYAEQDLNFNVKDSLKNNGAANMVLEMSENLGLSLDYLDTLVIGVSLPLQQAIFELRNLITCPDDLNFSERALKIVGRNDLALMAKIAVTVESNKKSLEKAEPVHASVSFSTTSPIMLCPPSISERAEIIRLRFSSDDRIQSVSEMFKYKEESLMADIGQSLTPDEIVAFQQNILKSWCSKPSALSLGRAMLTFDSCIIVSTDVFEIPPLPTAARCPPGNVLVELVIHNGGNNQSQNSTFMDWPEFHQGAACGIKIRQDCQDIDSSWIVFNQSKNQDGKHEVDPKHAGFLLGIGLNGHLKNIAFHDSLRYYLLPQYEMVSVGLLLGLGASFLGSRNTRITQMISVHIPSMLPENSSSLNTATTVRTAAIVSFGLIHFGSASPSLIDRILFNFTEMKHSDSDSENSNNTSFIIGCGFALGFISLGKSFVSQVDICKDLLKYTHGNDSHITRYGALIAIAMLGFNSKLEHIASKLAPPLNSYLLDFIEPDVLMLQTISRCMVLWDSVEPSFDWILSQVPPFMKSLINDLIAPLPTDHHVLNSYLSIIAGAGYCIGLKFAGSCNRSAFLTLKTILSRCEKVVRMVSKADFSDKLSLAIAKMCQTVCCVSLAIIMAGSGNLEAFQILKNTQKASCEDLGSCFGNQMGLNMAIGMLFLGSGTCTLGSSKQSIFMLFCALFPIFPASLAENRYHLQALRHLWVLAVDRRCLITRESKSGEMEVVPVDVILKSGVALSSFTPLILPEFEMVESIKIIGPRYFNYEIDLAKLVKHQQGYNFCGDGAIDTRPLAIYVQRKSMHLSYMADPEGKRGILSTSFPRNSSEEKVDYSLSSQEQKFMENFFSGENKIQAFLKYFCSLDCEDENRNEFGSFSRRVLYRCLSRNDGTDRQIGGPFLWIYRCMKMLFEGNATPFMMTNLRIIIILSKNLLISCDNQRSDLINGGGIVDVNFVSLLEDKIDRFFHSFQEFDSELTPKSSSKSCLAKYFQNRNGFLFCLAKYLGLLASPKGDKIQLTAEQSSILACYVAYHGWPGALTLSKIQQTHRSELMQIKVAENNFLESQNVLGSELMFDLRRRYGVSLKSIQMIVDALCQSLEFSDVDLC